MSNLTILNTAIRQINNLFSLNDLHAISGSECKHKPSNFIRIDTTQELIEEIQKEDPSKPVVVRKNGIGTYACMEIALAYAMWIDPKFHLIVLRAYMAMKNDELQNQQQNLPLARQERMMTVRLPESDLKDIAWLWFAADKMQKFIDSLQPALQILGSNLYGTAYSYQKEYGDLIQFIGPMIYKLTKDVDFSDRPTPIKALEQAIAQPKPKRLAKF